MIKSLLKIGKFKLAGIVAIVPVLITGTVFTYNIATPSKPVGNSAQTEQASTVKKTDKPASDSGQADTTPSDQTTSESSDSTSTQTTTQAPTTAQPTQTATNTTPQQAATSPTTTQPTQTATNTAPQQTATNPTPATPTCNESMKSSYTSLYNSKVNAENASWYNQIEAWNNDAARRGVSFGGYVQGMINDNKPAHDARLAQLQNQYYQNLASINCSP